ncbi:Hypothetical predicted protein, partial [Mytilus galloprovincialis]
VNYIIANDLGGAMVWAIDLDDFNGICGNGAYPLTSKMKNMFNASSHEYISTPISSTADITTLKTSDDTLTETIYTSTESFFNDIFSTKDTTTTPVSSKSDKSTSHSTKNIILTRESTAHDTPTDSPTDVPTDSPTQIKTEQTTSYTSDTNMESTDKSTKQSSEMLNTSTERLNSTVSELTTKSEQFNWTDKTSTEVSSSATELLTTFNDSLLPKVITDTSTVDTTEPIPTTPGSISLTETDHTEVTLSPSSLTTSKLKFPDSQEYSRGIYTSLR